MRFYAVERLVFFSSSLCQWMIHLVLVVTVLNSLCLSNQWKYGNRCRNPNLQLTDIYVISVQH
jgi:hypothetical protein